LIWLGLQRSVSPQSAGLRSLTAKFQLRPQTRPPFGGRLKLPESNSLTKTALARVSASEGREEQPGNERQKRNKSSDGPMRLRESERVSSRKCNSGLFQFFERLARFSYRFSILPSCHDGHAGKRPVLQAILVARRCARLRRTAMHSATLFAANRGSSAQRTEPCSRTAAWARKHWTGVTRMLTYHC
jgi:hypothetical protein